MEQALAVSRKGRRQFLMIVGLFLLPPLAAWLAWQYLNSHGVTATTNNGTLILPARPVDLSLLDYAPGQSFDDLKGRWVFVTFARKGCDTVCEKQLYLTRQVRIGVNKDISRVRRLLVVAPGEAAAIRQTLRTSHPDLVVAAAGDDATFEAFHGDGFAADGSRFFLVDPLGNLMMFYRLDGQDGVIQGKGMLKDLQKLLKVSQIG